MAGPEMRAHRLMPGDAAPVLRGRWRIRVVRRGGRIGRGRRRLAPPQVGAQGRGQSRVAFGLVVVRTHGNRASAAPAP